MNTKRTKDIYFASALSAIGAELVGVDKTDPRHMEFEFSSEKLFDSPILRDAVKDGIVYTLDDYEIRWANGVFPINAVAYADAIKRMKSIVHSR